MHSRRKPLQQQQQQHRSGSVRELGRRQRRWQQEGRRETRASWARSVHAGAGCGLGTAACCGPLRASALVACRTGGQGAVCQQPGPQQRSRRRVPHARHVYRLARQSRAWDPAAGLAGGARLAAFRAGRISRVQQRTVLGAAGPGGSGGVGLRGALLCHWGPGRPAGCCGSVAALGCCRDTQESSARWRLGRGQRLR